jgi:hypothetical protein
MYMYVIGAILVFFYKIFLPTDHCAEQGGQKNLVFWIMIAFLCRILISVIKTFLKKGISIEDI